MPIVNFYTIDCPSCMLLEKKMNKKNIQYIKIKDKNMMLQKGIKILPQIEVDNTLMDFEASKKWVDNYNG